MRNSFLASTLLLTLAAASPIEKRVQETVWDVFTVWTTVTESPHAPTTVAAPAGVPVTTVWVAPSPKVTSSPVAATPASSAAAAPVASSAPAAASSASSTLSSYQQLILDQHNIHRANHSADPLTWDDDLAAIAQQIAATCVWGHSMNVNGVKYGQNIGAGRPATDIGKMITDDMYNGEFAAYPGPWGADTPSNMGTFESWGHLTQIVWKGTTKVACATQVCSSLSGITASDVPPIFSVCNYLPAGNVPGEYSNVGVPLGEAVVTV